MTSVIWAIVTLIGLAGAYDLLRRWLSQKTEAKQTKVELDAFRADLEVYRAQLADLGLKYTSINNRVQAMNAPRLGLR